MDQVVKNFGPLGDGFVVPAERFRDLEKLVAKLNRRTKRVGGAGLALEVIERGEMKERTWQNGVPRDRVRPFVFVRAVGNVPRVDAWQFVARVDHLAEGVVVVNRAPGAREKKLPEELWSASGRVCDHCKTNRGRSKTYVLEGAAGELRRVGGNCLADFSDRRSLEALNWFKLLEQLALVSAPEEGSEGGREWIYSVADFLACAEASVRQWGFHKANAECETTCQAALRLLNPPAKPEHRADWLACQPTEADLANAADILAWIRAMSPKSDYERNLFALCVLDAISPRHLGLLASAPQAWRRERGQIAERKARSVSARHLGTVGKREEFELLCVGKTFRDGEYGVSTIVRFVAEDGARAVWFASGVHDLDEGAKYKGKATVKKHEEYQGQPSTVLTRCSLEKVA